MRSGQIGTLLGSWRTTRGPGGTRLPEYAALAATVRLLLRDGRLPLAVRIPAERELATALNISRTTVTAAYRELRESGHLTSRRGAGSWTALPDGQRIGTSGLWEPSDGSGVLDMGCAALTAPEQLSEAVAEALTDLPAHAQGLGYYPAGLPTLREAVASGYVERGLPTTAEHILITSGAQHALDLILRLSVSPGQSTLVESPTYPNVITAIRSHRARVSPYHLDPGTGWDGDDLVATLRAVRPAMAYLIPEFHNPTGLLMPLAVRERLPGAAHVAGTDLVIDESFVDLAIDRPEEHPPPVALFDRHARVLSVGGMTKPYWGGLRVGWIRAAPAVIARLQAIRVAMDMAGPVLDQLVAVRLLERRAEIIASRREQLARQRDALLQALAQHLPGWRCTVPEGGLCLWVELDAPVSTALAHAAHEHGLRIAPGPLFGVDGPLERYLRMPFTMPEPDLEAAVKCLAAASADLDRARPAGWTATDLVA